MVEKICNEVLEAELAEHLGAGRHERTEERRGYRKGHYTRTLTTRVGRLELRVPRDRSGRFSTELFARYQRSEKALVPALMEMVVNGVSTRKVKRVTEELCGREFSKSTVSRLAQELAAAVKAWNERRLEGAYPFVLVDAMHIKVRRQGAVRATSALLAVGVNGPRYTRSAPPAAATSAWTNTTPGRNDGAPSGRRCSPPRDPRTSDQRVAIFHNFWDLNPRSPTAPSRGI